MLPGRRVNASVFQSQVEAWGRIRTAFATSVIRLVLQRTFRCVGSGRGLLLVQEFADSWGGWSLTDGLLGRGAGKLLWFEVGRQREGV